MPDPWWTMFLRLTTGQEEAVRQAEQGPGWLGWLSVVAMMVVAWLVMSDWFRRLK